MLAIGFDLDWLIVQAAHPSSGHQAYRDKVMARFGFEHIQQSVYLCRSDDMANLTKTMTALKALAWSPESVKDIRAFRVEQWSDFTAFIQENLP
jgi:virulence-associated protein VapD